MNTLLDRLPRDAALGCALLFLAVACGPQQGEPAATAPGAPSEIRITLDRTGCYGTCPVYTVSVDETGHATFTGVQFVAQPGTSALAVAPESVRALAQEILAAGFMDWTQEELQDCPERWTDNPSARLTVRIDERENSTDHYHGCRGKLLFERLTRLEDRVDEVLGTQALIAPDPDTPTPKLPPRNGR